MPRQLAYGRLLGNHSDRLHTNSCSSRPFQSRNKWDSWRCTETWRQQNAISHCSIGRCRFDSDHGELYFERIHTSILLQPQASSTNFSVPRIITEMFQNLKFIVWHRRLVNSGCVVRKGSRPHSWKVRYFYRWAYWYRHWWRHCKSSAIQGKHLRYSAVDSE